MSSSYGDGLGTGLGRASEDAHIITLSCTFCGKGFSGNRSHSGVYSNYRRHLLTHTHERPHKCRYCGAGFTTKPNMRRHIRFLHPLMVDSTDSSKVAGDSAIVVPLHTMESEKEGGIQVSSEPLSTSLVNREDNPHPESLDLKTMIQPPGLSSTSSSPRLGQPTWTDRSSQSLFPSQGEAKVDGCHYCGRCFSWLAIRLLHERRCSRRKGLPAAKTGNMTENTSFSIQLPASGDSRVTSSKVAHYPSSKGSIPSDILSQSSPMGTNTKHVFVCEDCELEVSSRSKLRRHQRYYCPFRDDVRADPLTDILAVGDDVGRLNPGMVGSDSEAECTYAHQLAERVGLKFVNNANISPSSEDNMYKRRYDSGSLEEVGEDERKRESSDDEYAWAYVSSIDATSSISLECSLESRSSLEKDQGDSGVEKQGGDRGLLDDQFHLDFKRRRSGNKRARRILLKRIRAQQRQLQLDDRNASPVRANRPHYSTDVGESDFIQGGTPTETCEYHRNNCLTAPDTSTPMFPSDSTSSRASKKVKRLVGSNGGELLCDGREEVYKSRGNDVIPTQWSLGLRSRAEALAGFSSKRVTHHSYVCPFDGCLGRFTKQRYWHAHAARCHPVEWLKYQKRLQTEEGR
ncbi:unnamed protein product [Phytomonas sp. EM1]|nr:unnamed protein product [Phytomonas sp. EM1]|eukprot:CCW65113.1 unnamed protein product [Phytomonas sp. isolate EM1]